MSRHLASLFLAAISAVGMLAGATASPAAQGLNLSWDHCQGEGTGVQNASFACNTNAGSHVIVGSFELAAPLERVSGIETNVDFAAASTEVPAWWEFRNAGSCRQFAISSSMQQEATDVVCVDWAQGQAVGGMNAYLGPQFGRPAHVARLYTISAVTQDVVQDLSPGTEYFAFSLRISHTNTVGAGSCGGCEVPVCIVFNLCTVATADVTELDVTGPSSADSNYIMWQGGNVPAVLDISCPAASTTPTRRSTWSAVKQHFR